MMTDHQDGTQERRDSDVHALSGAYAVDALDDLERARFQAHLQTCSDCRLEVAELRETAAHLGGLENVTPPDAVRAGILAGIEEVRPLPPELRSEQPGVATPLRRRSLWTALSSRTLLVAAAVAVLAVAGSLLVPQLSDDAIELSATDRVLAADDAVSVEHRFESGAIATVVLSRSEGRAVVVTEGMEPAPSGNVYELWLQTPEGDMNAAGLMPNRRDTTMLLDGDASEATAVGITIEPEGGSSAPTSDPIALFDLKS